MRWGSLLVCLYAAGCSLEDNLVACPGDTLCPAGSVWTACTPACPPFTTCP